MTIVVMNQDHKLFPEQEFLLKETFVNIDFLFVPSDGWTESEIRTHVRKLAMPNPPPGMWVETQMGEEVQVEGPVGGPASIVVVSPVPLLLGLLAKSGVQVFIFHNDIRVKKEVPTPDGGKKLISSVSPTGWKLIELT